MLRFDGIKSLCMMLMQENLCLLSTYKFLVFTWDASYAATGSYRFIEAST